MAHETPYVGRSMPRPQDPRLLRGQGRYVDDIEEVGAWHAAIVRSPVAHGRLTRFDATAVLAAGLARLVLGPQELARLADPLPTKWRLPGQHLTGIPVATTTARYVGQPLGVVVAASRAEAEDAAEQVLLEFDELAVVSDTVAATTPGAALLYPEHGSNIAGQIHFGSDDETLTAAIDAAPHVIDREFRVQRIAQSPMEPRGVLAEWIPGTGALTAWLSSQSPQAVRQELAVSLRLRADQVRVVATDVGGSFGGKNTLYVDETMVCAAAMVLGGRVKWIEDRRENLLAAYQGRGQRARARLALDAAGRFLAIHADIVGDLGAFASQAGSGPFQVTGLAIEGPYRFASAGATITGVYTNLVPTCAYRGYGMQEAAWIRERLIDEAARELGLDPVELRLRNLVTPAELPYTTHTMLTYDSGDYPAALRRAAELADRFRPAPDAPGGELRRGVGLACSVEVTGFAPSALLEMFQIHWAGWESGRIRVNEDGSVSVTSGVMAVGQGIETALAQIVADELRVPIDWIRVHLGDTAVSSYSDLSSQASRSVTLAGGALVQAGARMRERMRGLAAGALGVPADAVTWNGAVFGGGPGTGTLTWREVAHRGWMGWGRGDAARIQLEEVADFDPPAITYAYSVAGAAVAAETDTGRLTVEAYWSVNDSGVLVNPMLADGQLAGGIAQGLGLALLEEIRHDPETGQPLCTTLSDYLLPSPSDVPDPVIEHRCTPSTVIPGGFKGLGEGGIIPTAAAVGNALAAAVPEIAADLVATPLAPATLWPMLDKAGLADG
ncbi:MAG TPA: xanthine dehydrogenase family protein molybdopterin-binding subunit [Actinophytocola sp.]|uniref:xanthine dehydrogenase family protein molybdopterin-binding subunit n=1 Tax=Actinophytocola sp. TaxID=1872138 RepID=UPI002DB94265|nr:xanthine dehydrogenase family protein molybdopterin-binding subunit [Actinophytocola sp.]HEU5474355.1 xanthine dehydrogenase family protein molybdopterin-binding subunit [Actinophytocola sp.]